MWVRRIASVALLLVLCAGCGGATPVAAGPGRPEPRPSTPGAAAGTSSVPAEVSAATKPAAATPATTRTATTPAARTPSPSALARAASNHPCAGNRAMQLVTVRLSVQQLWMCERTHLVYGTPITSGIPGEDTSTPTGTYTVQARTRDTTLTLIDGRRYTVKYWIPFDAPLFGFHDSSWQHFSYGSNRYKTDGSHGCVHMPLTAIAFLYTWAEIGTKVLIRS